MTLRDMVFIGLRFYAVSLLAGVIPLLQTLIVFFGVANVPGSIWIGLSVPLAYLVMAGLIWFASGRLARGIAGEFNPAVQFQLTLEGALTFAFVFLGLYFILNSAATALIQLYNLLSMMGVQSRGYTMQTRSGNDLYRSGITLVAGLASLFCSRVWARKLAARGLKAEAP